MNTTLFPIPIGCLPVYEDEYNAAHEIIQAIHLDMNPVLLIAQPQQGKTGAIICFLDHSIRFAASNNQTLEILWITNVSNNSLVDQTLKRMQQAGILNKVNVVHRSQLKKVAINNIVDRRIIICDECHEAVKKDSNFIEFMNKIGVYYGSPKSSWTCKNTVVVSVSATPFAHVLKNILIEQKNKPYNERIFHEVVMGVSEDYYSIQDIKNDERFHQSSAILKKGKITDFFKNVIEEFLVNCKQDGPGYLVVRATGDKNITAIEKYLNVNYPNIDVNRYDSDKNNIASIKEAFDMNIPNPCVVIIRGTLRVGQTIKTTKNIRGWVESHSSNGDTTAQALRCLGYEMIDGKNRRFEDRFPIYCNTKEIEDIIQFYNERNCNRKTIPSGVGNKKSSLFKRNWYFYPIMDIDYSDATVKPNIDGVKNFLTNNGFDVSNKNGLTIHSIHDNNLHDLADGLCVATGFQQQYPTKINIYKVDEANVNHAESWKQLTILRPDLIGKFVVVLYKNDGKTHHISENMIDEKSTFAA